MNTAVLMYPEKLQFTEKRDQCSEHCMAAGGEGTKEEGYILGRVSNGGGVRGNSPQT